MQLGAADQIQPQFFLKEAQLAVHSLLEGGGAGALAQQHVQALLIGGELLHEALAAHPHHAAAVLSAAARLTNDLPQR